VAESATKISVPASAKYYSCTGSATLFGMGTGTYTYFSARKTLRIRGSRFLDFLDFQYIKLNLDWQKNSKTKED
jgi:hypothetical protein